MKIAIPADDYNDIRQAFPDDIGAPPTKSWWRDPADIPPRQFLYGGHYIRRAIGATIAAGGRGKTTLACYEAVAMAAGRDLSTGAPADPLRVWLLNGEEDQDEMDRRVAAVCQRYRVTKGDLGGRLYVQSVRDKPLRVATMGKTGSPVIDAKVITTMSGFISDNKIDVFMLDPLISFHSVPENDNGAMDVVIKAALGVIASKTNTAGEVFHHPGKPKPGQAETTVEDGRGASAILWAVRSARVLNFMAPEEAAKIGVSEDNRRRHIRIANGKANMGPLGSAKWTKIEVENLPNGDQIACATLWTPPDPFENVSTNDMEVARKVAQGGAYRADVQSKQWFGWRLAEHLQVPIRHGADNAPSDLARIKAIIKKWPQNKVLAIEEREDEHRKRRDYIIPGPFKPEPPPIITTAYDDDEITLN